MSWYLEQFGDDQYHNTSTNSNILLNWYIDQFGDNDYTLRNYNKYSDDLIL